MCGICGQVFFQPDQTVQPQVLEAMCATLRQRGPDDTGTYLRGPVGLGSTRLSIIDLEDGHMPLANEDRTVWIVYNGEVYNFPELRQRLQRAGHRFATRSDTEAIVHLYEEEGDDFVHRLNGMFALAIWDARRQRLVLARDRLGIKPLYYAARANGLLFASEIKALWPAGVEPQVDPVALHDYLSLGYVPGPRTILRGVCKLPPGHLLTVELAEGHIDVRRYWDYPKATEPSAGNGAPAHLEDQLLEFLRDSVSDTMISDVPVGAFLSGGVDSSLVVALMNQASACPVKTFSVGFRERSYDELPYARIVAQHFRTDHHELVLMPDVRDLVETMTASFDEPFADNSAVAVFAVSQLASRYVKVVLSGDGGDELFGGYYTYQADQLARLLRRLPGRTGTRLFEGLAALWPTSFDKASFDFKLKRFAQGAGLPPLAAHYAWKAYMSEEMKHRLYAGSNGNGAPLTTRPTVDLLEEYYNGYPTPDLLNRLLYVDGKAQLVDCMLTKVDRMSMAHSLEVRVPLLDHRVVEFMARLPSRYKVRGLTLKYLLKRVAAKVLPGEILRRPKGGFTIPLAYWIAHDLRDMVRDQLSHGKLKEQGFFNTQAVTTMLDAHEQGRQDYARSIWALFMFSRWCDRYLASA